MNRMEDCTARVTCAGERKPKSQNPNPNEIPTTKSQPQGEGPPPWGLGFRWDWDFLLPVGGRVDLVPAQEPVELTTIDAQVLRGPHDVPLAGAKSRDDGAGFLGGRFGGRPFHRRFVA